MAFYLGAQGNVNFKKGHGEKKVNTTAVDLIIVGAGIVGLSAAIQAREQGLTVRLFEKDAEAIGATRRNFGVVGTATLTYPDGVWRQYAKQTRQFYQRIQARTEISLQSRPALYLANTALQGQVLSEFAERAGRYDIQLEQLTAQQLYLRFPYIDQASKIDTALLVEGDHCVEPDLLAQRLLQYAMQLGVIIQCNACVVQSQSDLNTVTVQLATGQRYRAAKAMICHGESTEILYPNQLKSSGLLRCHLQMALTQAFKTQLDATIYSGLSIARYPAFEICPSYAALKQATQQGFVHDYGIHVLLKQNRLGQLIVGDSHQYQPVDAIQLYQQREEINQFIAQYCKENMGIRLPAIEMRWMGTYLQHPDQLAYVNEVEPNIYLISGIGGKGMTTAAGFIQDFLETHIF